MKPVTDEAVLGAILSATKRGDLVWSSDKGDYTAKGTADVVIKEICPLIAGDTDTAGVQAFELHVGSIILSFWSGTPGCSKIHEILAAADPSWREHNKWISERRRAIIQRLKGNKKSKRRRTTKKSNH